MSRNVLYWESKRTKANAEMMRASKVLRNLIPARAPRKHELRVAGFKPKDAESLYNQWKVRNARRRELRAVVEKLAKKIAYFDARIHELKTRTAWAKVGKDLF